MVLIVVGASNAQTAPLIELTDVPAFGTTANLGGKVLNASPSTNRVAVFIFVPGAGWYSKPFCDPQLTVIQPDGSWTADITTGSGDQYATRITALLVSSNYNEPCVDGPPALPTNVTAQAIASATVMRIDPSVRHLEFSGYDWWLKTSSDQVGPGPNYFSDSTNNVWLDGQGQLQLRITHRANQWQCAEAVTARTFGYGSYRFELGSTVNDLDPNVVLGLFTWSDDPAYAHREIDIECSRWSNVSDLNNAQYVVQPWDTAGHLARLNVPAGSTNSTHVFTWETNRVSFQSQGGAFDSSPSLPNQITNWTYALAVPPTGDENVRLNLWLYNGAAPVSTIEVEFVLRSFQFVPLGPPQPAWLSGASRLPGGEVHFIINGQADWRYRVQASENLTNWLELGTVLATDNIVDFIDASSAGLSGRFFRTVTMP